MGKTQILIVEDEPGVLKLGKRMLEGLGYTVLAASAPAAAINCWQWLTGGKARSLAMKNGWRWSTPKPQA